jgi:hypothetical protein
MRLRWNRKIKNWSIMKWRLVHTLANVMNIKDTNIDENMARKYMAPPTNKELKRDPAVL